MTMTQYWKTIPPAPASDWYSFDITADIGTISPAKIASVVWTCEVSPESGAGVTDDFPQQHILDDEFTNTQANVLIGNMTDGITYSVTAVITLDDKRVFIRYAQLLCLSQQSADPINPFTVESFRAQFPAFSDTAMYPSDQIDFWITLAITNPPINFYRIGQFYDLALRYWVAHNLALQRYMANQAIAGSPPIGSGVPASKSVNGVSVSYDTGISADPEAGPYNLTIYGQMFWQFLKMAGAAGSVVPSGYPAGTTFHGLGTITPWVFLG